MYPIFVLRGKINITLIHLQLWEPLLYEGKRKRKLCLEMRDCREKRQGNKGGQGKVTAVQKRDKEVRKEAERERICYHTSQRHVASQAAFIRRLLHG